MSFPLFMTIACTVVAVAGAAYCGYRVGDWTGYARGRADAERDVLEACERHGMIARRIAEVTE